MMDASSFPLIVDIPVQWGEMDSFGHVNNIIYFRYFETARIAYFERVGFIDEIATSGVGPILASTKCRFRSPLVYPDQVRVGVSAVDVKADRFTMLYGVWSEAQQKMAADGEGLIVAYDYNVKRKASLPERVKASISDLQKTLPAPPSG